MGVIVPTYYTEAEFTKLIPVFEEMKLSNMIRVLKHVQFDNEDFHSYLSDISELVIENDMSSDKAPKVVVRDQPVQISTKTSVDFHKKLKYLMYDLSLEHLPKELGTVEKELLPVIHWRMEIEK